MIISFVDFLFIVFKIKVVLELLIYLFLCIEKRKVYFIIYLINKKKFVYIFFRIIDIYLNIFIYD